MEQLRDEIIYVPTELLYIVILFAANSFSNLFHLSLTCKQLYEYISTPSLCQFTWKQAFIVQFPTEYHKILNKRWWRFGIRGDKISFEVWDKQFQHLCRSLCNDKARDRISAEYQQNMALVAKKFCNLEENYINVIILGDGGVGKSTAALQLAYGICIDEYDPTIEDSYTIYVTHEQTQQVFAISILDTAGQSEYSAMRDQYMRISEAVIIMYDVGNRNTFDDLIDNYIKTCYLVREVDHIPIIIAGNKKDREDERQVDAHDQQQLLQTSPFIRHVLTCATSRENIDLMIQELITVTLEFRQQHPMAKVRKQKKKKQKKKCLIS